MALTWWFDNLLRVIDGCRRRVGKRVVTRLVLSMYIYSGGLAVPTLLTNSYLMTLQRGVMRMVLGHMS